MEPRHTTRANACLLLDATCQTQPERELGERERGREREGEAGREGGRCSRKRDRKVERVGVLGEHKENKSFIYLES